MECKKALEEANGDMAKALEILSKRALVAVGKKADRTLGAGTVAAYIHNTGQVGALVMLSSETDFVSKNEEFVALARDIAMHAAAMRPADVTELLAQAVHQGSFKDHCRPYFWRNAEVWRAHRGRCDDCLGSSISGTLSPAHDAFLHQHACAIFIWGLFFLLSLKRYEMRTGAWSLRDRPRLSESFAVRFVLFVQYLLPFVARRSVACNAARGARYLDRRSCTRVLSVERLWRMLATMQHAMQPKRGGGPASTFLQEAALAQLVEQLFCKEKVPSSNLGGGSKLLCL
jgi:hypothetical protein